MIVTDRIWAHNLLRDGSQVLVSLLLTWLTHLLEIALLTWGFFHLVYQLLTRTYLFLNWHVIWLSLLIIGIVLILTHVRKRILGIQGVTTCWSCIIVTTLAWSWSSILCVSILLHSCGNTTTCGLIVHVIGYNIILALSDGVSHILRSILIDISSLIFGWCQMSANSRVLMVTILLAEITILSIVHHAQSYISVRLRSIWSLQQIIIRSKLTILNVAIVDTLWNRLRNRTLNHILFRAFCWWPYTWFCSPVLYILLIKIVHAINLNPFGRKFIYRFADETLIILRLFCCALLRSLVRKSTVSCNI